MHDLDGVRGQLRAGARLSRVIQAKTVDKMISRTEAYWKLWVRKDTIDTSVLPESVRELFIRSQLILRTQIDNRGAIIAATDSDISHFAGDHYAYCWPRDGALVAYALVQTGQSELSRSFFRYCSRVINKNGYFMHKYPPAGHLASSWHPWVTGGTGGAGGGSGAAGAASQCSRSSRTRRRWCSGPFAGTSRRSGMWSSSSRYTTHLWWPSRRNGS